MARWCIDTEVLSLCPNATLFRMAMSALEHLEWLLKLFLGYHTPAFLASVLLLSLPSKQIASSRMLPDKTCIQLYLTDFLCGPLLKKITFEPRKWQHQWSQHRIKNKQSYVKQKQRSIIRHWMQEGNQIVTSLQTPVQRGGLSSQWYIH